MPTNKQKQKNLTTRQNDQQYKQILCPYELKNLKLQFFQYIQET